METPAAKKVYTEAERLELAEKLDKACDDFMEELAANQKDEPKKPFDFDEWCKEIDNHPAFMKDLSVNGELPEALQALQALKYDTDGEDLLDTATNHKDEGNKHFKYKKYRWAIDCYTQAAKLMAMLRCCELLSEFEKTGKRTLQFSTNFIEKLQNPPEGREKEFAEAKEKLEIIKEIAAKRVEKEKIEAPKRQAALLKDLQKKEKILQMFKKRGLEFKPEIDYKNYREFEWTMLDVNFPHRPTTRVDFEPGTDILEWPLMLQYPETAQTDFLTECPETFTIRTLIEPVLEQPAEWDSNHAFQLSDVRVFVALDIFDDEQIKEISMEDTLGDVISSKDYLIVQGLPVIQIYTKSYIASKLTPVEGKTGIYKFKKN
uniref:Cns1/TTC4 wheel domain-containing protein n=1 Tax=Panagrolaimus sp. ES5 TaxID=591445 RepID=A0AC34F2C2_9BILA